jgi:glycosyltransferase involved in cell wall biosynthesis
MEKNRILVIVPCFNEAERLPVSRFVEFIELWENYDFLFVNDGSTDTTENLLKSICSKEPDRFYFLHLKVNEGKAQAVREGMLHALNMGEYAYFGFLDADLATPLSELPYLLDYAEFMGGNKQFIFGSRIKILGSNIDRNPMRHYFGRISATGASVSLNLPVYDTQCGVKFFHSSVVPSIFKEPFSSRWLFDVEIFFRFKTELDKDSFYKSVLEVPLRVWNEIPGTKIRFSDILKVPLELYRINRRYIRHCRF